MTPTAESRIGMTIVTIKKLSKFSIPTNYARKIDGMAQLDTQATIRQLPKFIAILVRRHATS